jgi:hypothetical protein
MPYAEALEPKALLAFLVSGAPSAAAGTAVFDGLTGNSSVVLGDTTQTNRVLADETSSVDPTKGSFTGLTYNGNAVAGLKTISLTTKVVSDGSATPDTASAFTQVSSSPSLIPVQIVANAAAHEVNGEPVQIILTGSYTGSVSPVSNGSNAFLIAYSAPGGTSTNLLNGTDTGTGSPQTKTVTFLATIGQTFDVEVSSTSTQTNTAGTSTISAALGLTMKANVQVPPNDFDGSGKSDIAVYLPTIGAFAYRPANGGPDQVIGFGQPGLGNTIPSPGDFDGAGKTELGAYIPSIGAFAFRPSTGVDQIVPFGIPGKGNDIPAVGDYDGSGKDELGVYLPTIGAYAYRPASGNDVLIPFGTAGAGQSIPVPGDYFGTGQDDVAVFLTSSATFAILAPGNKTGEMIPFGQPGLGNSIPVPGDYDGSGKTELAVYIPSLGALIYRPANGGPDVAIAWGSPGVGASLPEPGDYDGTGKTDIAVYLPTFGALAYRPDNGTPGQIVAFGIPGVGNGLPAAAVTGSYINYFVPANEGGGTSAIHRSSPDFIGTFQTTGDLTGGQVTSGTLTANLGTNPSGTVEGTATISSFPIVTGGAIIATEDSTTGSIQGTFEAGEDASSGTFTFSFSDQPTVTLSWRGTLIGSSFTGTLFGTGGTPFGTFTLLS